MAIWSEHTERKKKTKKNKAMIGPTTDIDTQTKFS